METFKVEVKITITTMLRIEADSEADAKEKASDIVSADGYAPDTHLISTHHDREYTVFPDYN